MGVHVDEGQGAVRGGAGAEDGVGDQVVTTQAHWNTLVGEYCPEEDVSSAAHVTASLNLYCSVMLSQAARTLYRLATTSPISATCNQKTNLNHFRDLLGSMLRCHKSHSYNL